MCITCGCLARKKIGNLVNKCRPPTTAGRRNLNNYIKGKAPTNCSGWPFKTQFQRPFAFLAPPGKIGCADTLTIARVLEQVTAAAQFERIQLAVINNSSSGCAEDPGDCTPYVASTLHNVTLPPINYNHGLDYPERISCEQSDEEYMEQNCEVQAGPDGLPDELEETVFSDSD